MKLIGLSGKKQTGKDMVCTLLTKHSKSPVIRLAFADELKQEVARALGTSVVFIEADKEYFRPLLQWWGTYRRRTNPSYWIDKVFTKALKMPDPTATFVITDARYLNEVEAIRYCNGTIIGVLRPSNNMEDTHDSESLAGITYDYVINNTHTVESLEQQVIELIHKLNL